MQSIEQIIEPYVDLERNIRTLMTELVSTTCGSCTACCCRADICEEATESAFLSLLLKRQSLAAKDMDDRYGWLALDGCSLEFGRPPICYSYFCDELLARLPDEDGQFAIRVLGKLLDHIGIEALGSWHLTEIMNPDDLDRIDAQLLEQRIDDAQKAFEVVEAYMQQGRLSLSDREVLHSIRMDED